MCVCVCTAYIVQKDKGDTNLPLNTFGSKVANAFGTNAWWAQNHCDFEIPWSVDLDKSHTADDSVRPIHHSDYEHSAHDDYGIPNNKIYFYIQHNAPRTIDWKQTKFNRVPKSNQIFRFFRIYLLPLGLKPFFFSTNWTISTTNEQYERQKKIDE